ncbi:MAG: RNA-directed DNA polymerase [Lachnospiraceae bacterium]|nr:RNA-directed DNA polymerase [Lachnospiraceae bacterium]
MGVFDKMLSSEYKERFIEKKNNKFGLNEDYKQLIKAYIYSEECDKDIIALKNGDYFLPPPKQHYVRKSHSTKRRKVYSFRDNSRYILQYMAFVLMDFDHLYVPYLCSFRTDNRTKSFFKTLRKFDPHRELFVMQTDIHDFGGSVDQDILLDIVRPLFEDDPEFMAFLSWLMTRNQFYYKGKLYNEKVSIIEGLPIGSFLLNNYLRSIDNILDPKAGMYVRYTDDIAFFTDSEEKAKWALSVVRDYSKKLNVEVNEEKTGIRKPGEEVELLGIQIYDGGYDIGRNAISKLKSKLKRKSDRLIRDQRYGRITPEKAMEYMVKFYDRTFFGKKVEDHEFNWVIHAFPIITRTDSLKELDSHSQDCIRKAVSGKLGNAKYRVKYDDMRRAGYKNLLHAYYHGYTFEEV